MLILLFLVGLTLLIVGCYGLYIQRPGQPDQRVPPQAPQRLMLTDSRLNAWIERVQRAIDALPMRAADKRQLYQFVMDADNRLYRLMAAEGVPVIRTDVQFGALTVTFRLKLREVGRRHLDNLMKLDQLITQALCVESVRLIPGPGYIDCEVSSPMRVTVDVRALQHATRGDTVAVGMDTKLQPLTIDLAQHGLIGAIGPSRRGKTQAVRSLLYQLKAANPDYKIVIVAVKAVDWIAFEGCATIILDTVESKKFQTWLLSEMSARAKRPRPDRWIVVFDDLANQVQIDKGVADTVAQTASLGAGTGITTIASTQMTGAFSGGSAVFANCTAKVMFKPSSNQQAARDGGFAGLGLDQLSEQRGDCIALIDGYPIRLTTALTPDSLIRQLPDDTVDRPWLSPTSEAMTGLALHPMEVLIEKLDGWLLEDGSFDWDSGKFSNRSEALKRLEWSNNGRTTKQLKELEQYIFEQHNS